MKPRNRGARIARTWLPWLAAPVLACSALGQSTATSRTPSPRPPLTRFNADGSSSPEVRSVWTRRPATEPDPSPRAPPDPGLSDARSALSGAESLQGAGDYAGAITQAEKALHLLRGTSAGERLTMARSLGLLGELYWLRGDFARAETSLLRALNVYETDLPTSHPDTAALLNKLAILYQSRGLYGQAEPLHQRALRIQEAALGRSHPDVAATLNDLANLYMEQGLYGQAAPLHQRALLIRSAPGTGDPGVASSLANLAAVYKAQGRYDQAEPLARHALRLQEATLGAGHPDVALTLIDLATLLEARGRYEQAEPLARRALHIQEVALGPKHPLFARSLQELATIHRKQGSLDEADQLARRALAIRKAVLGDRHPDVAASLEDLAQLRVAQGRLDDAVPLFGRAFALSEERLRREALDFSESRLAGFLQYLRADEERLYALARAHPEHPGVRRLALTAALLWKGRSAEETANTSRVVHRSLGPEDRELFARLRDLRSQLARLSMDGQDPLSRADRRRQVKELVDQGDALEARLAKRSGRLRALVALPAAAEVVDRVAGALPPDGALVEIAAYREELERGSPGQLRYLALVLLPDGRIQSADLGPAEPIDAAAGRLRDALAEEEPGYRAGAEALHAMVFQPLRPLLGGARDVFLSPDGQLSLVPFAALHDGRGFLGDTYSFTYLTSGKDLLPRALDAAPSRSVVVIADPDFQALPGALVASADDRMIAELERSRSVERALPAFRFDAAGRGWAALPGTRRESEALQRLFPQAQVFAGADATKDRLLHVVSPGILHVATHGFFLPDASAPAGTRALGAAPAGERSPLSSPDPLLRS
ncbi:MAG TPA: tetratricopeptide repeat protein, partial [Myxococcales bacterium]|nr:tetratricopeptide repeat protein [Myxococcales bacterium]